MTHSMTMPSTDAGGITMPVDVPDSTTSPASTSSGRVDGVTGTTDVGGVSDMLGWFRGEPVLAATGWFIALTLAITVPALWVDTRLFQGENVWIKPIKFQVALAVYLLTLAAYARWVPRSIRERRDWKAYVVLVAFACLFELAVISGAAMHATASHYNIGTPLMAALYGAMGVFAVLLTSASLVYGIAIWRNRSTHLVPALHLSIALGMVMTFVLTLPVAGTLSSMPGHFIGIPTTGAVVPVMGWSREVGDLRVAHFIATHALHLLPIAGWLLSRRGDRAEAQRWVWGVAAVYVAIVVGTYVQALLGLPLVAVNG